MVESSLKLAPSNPAILRGGDQTRLVDSFGRIHRSMRLSIIDKCQLRCTYCMPAEGLPWLTKSELLTIEEIVRIAEVAYSAGFTEFRITGGEPLIRRDVPEIVRQLRALETPDNPLDLSLTTNAVLLDRYAHDLQAAGLDRVNVSLDTLRQDRFKRLTLRDQLPDVLEGLRAAREAGLGPIKLNTLLIPGVNEDEVLDLTDFAVTHGYQLRFIEQMPLGESPWDGSTIITQQEILEQLATKYTLEEVPGRGSAPAQRWYLNGGPASVGVIASVTKPFCGDCDRLRLTADGQLRTCLFSDRETDLRTPLRNGASNEELLDIMGMATWAKEAGHLIGKAGFKLPRRGMSAIGG